jgi:hydroxymethylpyrimidine/phosphomethylpyrimidine kinase
LEEGALDAYLQKIFPLTFLLTPNLEEAGVFSGIQIKTISDMEAAAEKIHALGVRHVLIKGGHLPDGNDALDLLFDGTEHEVFSSERIETKHTHGIGCTLASAIAARLAQGDTIYAAVDSAKKYISAASEPG